MSEIPMSPVFEFEKETEPPKPKPKTPKYMESINIHEAHSVYEIFTTQKPYIDLRRFGIRGYLGAMPGCCGYGVYYEVPSSKEDIESATNVLEMILESNQDEKGGFGSVITTVATIEQRNCFEEFGWGQINKHKNPLTGNIIYTLILEL